MAKVYYTRPSLILNMKLLLISLKGLLISTYKIENNRRSCIIEFFTKRSTGD